jgi:pyridoxine 5-phosphate synthase
MPHLGVNIDHVATLRQARYRSGPGGSAGYGEPDVVQAAFEAQLGGAECITVHLREDRRHVVDRDVELLARTVTVKFNLEMAGTAEMVALAQRLRVHQATLVPEGRAEVTTEGGLDVAGDLPRWAAVVAALKGAGVSASAFIDPDERQVEASRRAGFDACELHTGRYAHAFAAAGGDFRRADLAREFGLLAAAGARVVAGGMALHAGHALTVVNVPRVAAIPGMHELHIGHTLVARAVFVGLREAVREMRAAIGGAR